MTDAVAERADQLAVEQGSIDRMYECLDAELAAAVAAKEAAQRSQVDGAESRGARDAELARWTERIARLRPAEQSLCFGRIDAAGGESLHIGRIGLRSATGEILLVDWRADAARPFYTATPVSPQGLRRRRHLRTEAREVLDVSDELLDATAPSAEDVLGDGPLASALSEARTGRMRDAASTLQQEQDEIVRSEHRGVMVVDGGPGTGKTIVALHRAAYVLYAFPAIARRGVLVFGPNRRFLSYISEVLPSLGENGVDLATTPDLVRLSATGTESVSVTRAKGRLGFARALERKVEARQPQGVPLRCRTAHGDVVLEPARVDAARRGALQGGAGHNRGRAVFLEHVVDEVVHELERQTAQGITDFEDELKEASGIDLDRMFGGTQGGDGSAHEDLEIDWDAIRDDLLVDASIDSAIEAVWPRLRAEDVLREVLTDEGALAEAAPELSAEEIASVVEAAGAGWGSADLPLYDEAFALIDGAPEVTFGHIVVDEAQQLTAMEWRMLMRRCPSRSMTVVGDLAQAGPTTTISSWDEALSPFVGERYLRSTLSINYRTTAEILEAAAPVLALIDPTQRISRSIRHGEAPVHLTVDGDDPVPALRDLLRRLRSEHADELIGVIAATGRARGLEDDPIAEGVTVVAAPDARGLEFDTVIIVDPDEIQGQGAAGLRDLYVARTRATRRLVTLGRARDGSADPLS